jgi:hypothetical protein
MTPEQKELIDEGKHLEAVLQNGSRGDPGVISDAVRYLIRVNRIQAHAEFVTDKECTRRMANLAACSAPKPQWTWAKTTGLLGTVAMLVGLALKLWG